MTDIRRISGRYVGMQSGTILSSVLDPHTKNLCPFIPDIEHEAVGGHMGATLHSYACAGQGWMFGKLGYYGEARMML